MMRAVKVAIAEALADDRAVASLVHRGHCQVNSPPGTMPG